MIMAIVEIKITKKIIEQYYIKCLFLYMRH